MRELDARIRANPSDRRTATAIATYERLGDLLREAQAEARSGP